MGSSEIQSASPYIPDEALYSLDWGSRPPKWVIKIYVWPCPIGGKRQERIRGLSTITLFRYERINIEWYTFENALAKKPTKLYQKLISMWVNYEKYILMRSALLPLQSPNNWPI